MMRRMLGAAAVLAVGVMAAADVVDVRVIVTPMGEPVASQRAAIAEGRPALRGYKAPILSGRTQAWPIEAPGAGAPEAERAAAELVGRRLATDGLLFTTAQALALMPPPEANRAPDPIGFLMRVGIPTDLLLCFDSGARTPHNLGVLLERMVEVVQAGVRGAELKDAVNTMFPFAWRRSQESFRAASESGEHDLVMLRMQMTRGDDWQAQGDGGNLDMMRALVRALPDAKFMASVETAHRERFVLSLRTWLTPETAARVTVLEEPLKVTQWAGDNGKAGWINEAGTGRSRLATLTPRYASRGEDGSAFVPGDSFLMDGLASAGHQVIQSSLLFQGGNLLIVTRPADGRRLMLLGESEVYRNIALGLTREQAVEAFRQEFAVDEVAVLPSISFHIDYEVSVRAKGNELVAFVNDSPSALQHILYSGVGALERAGRLDAADADAARQQLQAGRLGEFLNGPVGEVVLGSQKEFGQFPESVAKAFAVSPGDSHVGNFRVFLLAMDMAASFLMRPEDLPMEPHPRAYLQSFQRREGQRAEMLRQLAGLGMRVVPVPSLSDEARGINVLNGIHDRTRYLMPAWGGLYSQLDEAAARVFRAELGEGVMVIPIPSAESQRRVGAVHCSAGAYYDPATGPGKGVTTP